MARSRSASASPSTAAAAASGSKTAKVQAQVDEVINVMHNNIEKVIARGEKLENLKDKTDSLREGAIQFRKGASKVKSQMVWIDIEDASSNICFPLVV
ncbi:hypothetical protein HDU97_009381 [Phlyctochytrium planicorne]|nr:hypothetical protein HDU97_009381 [Phlyctochytrium planicorne]